ncbi:MAG TPA: methylenetetrahydrofolate--tRNA-(uracil(54)-C(5))-methyltransferase (FADH(2)-oxidizing) TrmFO [Fredinandcohnia sp.]|nr:methylenetetrahydrofolate--tRNA-(uracil(54)-C(5))-methyltransferase (FADH(2)-oxidizing) TrmFO [Fredinandcohnia sp.]
MREITIIGGGLAGCEAAWQLAERGHEVRLIEMKPIRRTPAQVSDSLAELVCSNSFRSKDPENAIGLLHEELRKMGSLIFRMADAHEVPAGGALAVDRKLFSEAVTRAIENHPNIEVERREVEEVPSTDHPVVIATGPLTSDALARDIARRTGWGDELYFYDAIAPIVAAESIDMSVAFAQSRHGKGGDDYLNLPLDEATYHRFVQMLREGEKVTPHAFEDPKYFEGCLPIEVLAERGDETLAHGPMKPVGLVDPRTGERPYAVVQLRPEDVGKTAYNMVGFQTRLTWPEQRRIFRTLPGLENAEFLRLGQIHRNTFIDGPALLNPDFSLKADPNLFFAGQITGVEGYVESTAVGLLVGLAIDARLRGRTFVPPPGATALGALCRHVSGAAHPPGYDYQPSNVNWALFEPLDERVPKKARRARMVERARRALSEWMGTAPAVLEAAS